MARQHYGIRKAKELLLLILLLLFSMLFFTRAQADQAGETAVYECSLMPNDTICIDRYLGDANIVFIPSQVYGRDVTKIGKYAFQGCSAKRIYTPETLIEIEEGAFQNCKQLEHIKLKNGLERVGKFAFRGCEKMNTITLPASLREVDGSAFILCSILRTIHVEADSPWFREYQGMLYTKDATCLVSVPAAKRVKELYVYTTLEQIGDYACYRQAYLQKFYVDYTAVKRIGDYAFAGCMELEKGQLNDKLEEIGSYAFAACPKMLELTIPASVVRLGEDAFLANDYMMLDLTPGSATENYARENGVMYSFEPEW